MEKVIEVIQFKGYFEEFCSNNRKGSVQDIEGNRNNRDL